MGILEKIAEVEREIARTQKNKATEYHLGLLKAKLAKYRSELLNTNASSGKTGEGFDVVKFGDARVALIGFPSVGKYEGAKIQLLDLPGIIEGAAQGKGRGRQVIAVSRTADLILIMLDASKPEIHKKLLENELESVGIRLNKKKPDIYFKIKKAGGMKINFVCKPTRINEKMIQMILHEYKIFNADVIVREDCTSEEFIDVVMNNRVYIKCIYVYNKIDNVSLEEVDRLARQPNSIVVSCYLNLNLDFLVDELWRRLQLIQIYTKRRGDKPDLDDGIIFRKNATIEDVCKSIHKTMVQEFKYALVWGTSVKFSPQRVGLQHVIHNCDVIQILKK